MQKRYLERPALDLGESSEDGARNALEQIGHGGEREFRLRLRRPAGKHAKTSAFGQPDRVAPDRRLADAGLALEHERDEALARVRKKLLGD
ncbi:MAG: hypothetical protein H0U03_12345 [Actinobacteria bacterium]|nr:hypothetical protein [Actinomycetota bacterium]